MSARAASSKAGRCVIRSDRPDGRMATTAGLVHHRLRTLKPELSFNPDFTPRQFEAWKRAVRSRLRRLVGVARVPAQPAPKMVSDEPRDGYRLQRWELYPEPDCVESMLLLVPDGVSPRNRAPAVLCLPGSDHPNERVAGEPAPAGADWRLPEHNAMARLIAKKGMVALCIENPGTGSLFDPRAPDWRRQVGELIWLGTSYEALSVRHKLAALAWLKRLPIVDGRRIAACGFSLGAKPAVMLGVLEPGLRAVVWNSGAYDWRVRHVATNLVPVAPWHYIPGFIRWFDYLDLTAALAPMPVMLSEGGRTDELRKVRRAYALAGAPRHFALSYCPSWRDAAKRKLDRVPLPEGVTPDEYLSYLSGSNGEHFFHDDVVVPWLCRVLA